MENYRNRWYRKASNVYTILPGQEAFDDELFCDYFLCNSRARSEQLFVGRHSPSPPPYVDDEPITTGGGIILIGQPLGLKKPIDIEASTAL